MVALWEIAKAACEMLPGEPGKEPVGRVVTISSLTGTTIVSTTGLLFGGLSEQAYAQKWAWRPKAANTTDTVRMTTAYAPDTGTLTVATMSDTTATDEYCLISQFSPFEWRLAINRAVATTRYLDMTTIPGQYHRQIVREELSGRGAEDFFGLRCVELRENGGIDLRHALMLEHVIEHAVLVDVVSPFDGLVEHHEEEPVHRLRKKKLEQSFILDAVRVRHVPGLVRRVKGTAPAAGCQKRVELQPRPSFIDQRACFGSP